MRKEVEQLAIAFDNLLTSLLQPAAEQETEQPASVKPKQVARSAKRTEPPIASSVEVTSRAELNKMLTPGLKLNQSVDDPEQTNDYQILKRKLSYRPFDLNQAAGCFKQGSAVEALKILKHLEREKLARPIDEDYTTWILEKQ